MGAEEQRTMALLHGVRKSLPETVIFEGDSSRVWERSWLYSLQMWGGLCLPSRNREEVGSAGVW